MIIEILGLPCYVLCDFGFCSTGIRLRTGFHLAPLPWQAVPGSAGESRAEEATVGLPMLFPPNPLLTAFPEPGVRPNRDKIARGGSHV
jgi:hypothetical protein